MAIRTQNMASRVNYPQGLFSSVCPPFAYCSYEKGLLMEMILVSVIFCERVLLALSVCRHGKGHDVSVFP